MTLPERVRSSAKRAKTVVERADLDLAEKVALEPRSKAGRRVSAFAELGDQPPLQILSGVVLAAGVASGNDRLTRCGARMLAAHSLATLAKGAIKDRIDRTRPAKALGSGTHKLEAGTSKDGELRSMPSGHSAGLAAIAGAIATDYPKAALPAAALAGGIAAAQLPSRNHFISDVLAGTAIGLIAAALVNFAAARSGLDD